MASDYDTTDFDSEIGKDFKRMKDGFIRSREGRIIAKYDGAWLRDGQGKLVAHYDSRNDITKTREGRIVGKSDMRLYQLGKDQRAK
jgi:hypothetical protein